jgi:hypothetical protein
MSRFEPGGPVNVETNQLTNLLEDLKERTDAFRGYL